MILLDTNAVIWLAAGHQRSRPLRGKPRLAVSPATLLELAFLEELGRVRLRVGLSARAMADDPRWIVDNPDSDALFSAAAGESWTHDPFDRLIVGHAKLRGWRLATGDSEILGRLDSAATFEL